jgi:hypothetical protein
MISLSDEKTYLGFLINEKSGLVGVGGDGSEIGVSTRRQMLTALISDCYEDLTRLLAELHERSAFWGTLRAMLGSQQLCQPAFSPRWQKASH